MGGGFGVVKLVKDNSKTAAGTAGTGGGSRQAVYALKEMSKQSIRTMGNTFCFAAGEEKRLLQRLKHPFIVELLAAMSTPNSLFFLFEFCQGGDLYGKVVGIEESGQKVSQE